MATKERELQRLKAEADAIDSDRARTEEEKKKMRAAFEEKVESVQRQLLQLQKQLKEGEAAKVWVVLVKKIVDDNHIMILMITIMMMMIMTMIMMISDDTVMIMVVIMKMMERFSCGFLIAQHCSLFYKLFLHI